MLSIFNLQEGLGRDRRDLKEIAVSTRNSIDPAQVRIIGELL